MNHRITAVSLKISLFLLAALFSFQSATMANNPLDKYRWKNRVIVIHAPDNKTAASELKNLEKQIALQKAALKDRDLLLLHVGELPRRAPGYATHLSESEAASIRARLNLTGQDLQLVLIGKDGGTKSIQKGLQANLDAFFVLIDAMPMRRQEMRDRS